MKECANCREDLVPGDEVKWEDAHDLYFCNTNCASEFFNENPELLNDYMGEVGNIQDVLSTRILA